MMFSVVIPTCHRDDLLTRCLDRLAPGAQTFAADRYEVIVTDDGSRSTAQELVARSYPWARWTAGPRRGPAANRNHGARHARGQWAVFLDDDCVPDAGWLAAFATAITADPDQSVIEGRVYVDRPRRSLGEVSPVNETGGYLWSCNVAIRKEVFDEVGGFNEIFPHAAMEDVDLARRLRHAGHDPLFLPEAAVCHPWRPMGGWRAQRRHQASTWTYLALHPEEQFRINTAYYMRKLLRESIRQTLPGIFRYRGAGLYSALVAHVTDFQMALALLFLNPPRLSPTRRGGGQRA